MPKVNYLRSLIEELDPQELKKIVEEYATNDKTFEAFLLEKSGKKIDTGKRYEDYRDELEAVLKKCTTRKGFVKVGRLNKSGVESFRKLLLSHFKNENYLTSLWMSLVLLDILHRAILMNTRYQSFQKPYKVFEKMFEETCDIFDTAYKFADPERKERPEIFKTLLRCFWKERERTYNRHYFEMEDLFQYVKRDEDLMALQICLQELKPRALELDKKHKKGFLLGLTARYEENSYASLLEKLEKEVKTRLNEW